MFELKGLFNDTLFQLFLPFYDRYCVQLGAMFFLQDLQLSKKKKKEDEEEGKETKEEKKKEKEDKE